MSDLDSDPEAAAMAAAMGFSSFGAAPVKKKRKFNPVTDAFVEGDALAKIDRGGKKGKGSGGNEVPLGRRRILGAAAVGGVENMEGGVAKRNEDEIELDFGDEDEDVHEGAGQGGVKLDGSGVEGDEGPAYIDTSLPPPIEAGTDGGPEYMDTSLPPPAEARANPEVQARIDQILASMQPPPSDIAPPGTSSSYGQRSIHNLPPPTGELPARPMFPRPNSGFGGLGGRGRGGMSDAGSVSSGGRGRGERNPEWYIGYYDPSFNENPWQRLERDRGIGSVGTWIDRPRREV